MLFKITHNLVALDFCIFFGLTNYTSTRGHNYKLVKPICHSNGRQFSFACRRIDARNDLPVNAVNALSLSSFKYLLQSSCKRFHSFIHSFISCFIRKRLKCLKPRDDYTVPNARLQITFICRRSRIANRFVVDEGRRVDWCSLSSDFIKLHTCLCLCGLRTASSENRFTVGLTNRLLH